MPRICFLVLAGFVLSGAAAAGPDGLVHVIDGDTIRVSSETVRLHGIDAPEIDQDCTRPDGEKWACGRWSAQEVHRLFEGRRATCETMETDRYGRTVARCEVNGRDMGAAIVESGLATAFRRYSDDYVEIEKAAILAGRGIFGSDLDPPAEFRAMEPVAPQQAPGRCVIKGNISSSGRIYHVPGQEHYAKTRVNEARGERWFCTEAEARAAGWRKARR